MKKIPVLLLMIGLLPACHSQSDTAVNAKTDSAAVKHQEQEEKSVGLVLNNGARWKADSITKSNVSLLQAIVSGAAKNSPVNYSQTVTQLQDGLTKMVTECKMKGADHEALHHWLLPLMEKTKELKAANCVEKAAPVLKEIEAHINLFTQYFE